MAVSLITAMMNADERMVIPMQYLIIKAEPRNDPEHANRYLGASVGCWIKNQTRADAYLTAKRLIETEGWNVVDLVEQHPVDAGTYADETESRSYFEQALEDKEVLVFFTFNKGEPGN